MTTLLYVTDLAYQAQGRRYGDEDVYVTSRLREHFDLALAHPRDAAALMGHFDVVVVRNSGPVLHYVEAYAAFRQQALDSGACVYNPLSGRGDMSGKQYLLDLTVGGFPVVPTVSGPEWRTGLPETGSYVVKPKLGADSVGLRRVGRDELERLRLDDELLVQPAVDLAYEVSFYFVDRTFRYALHAPDPARRWELVRYEPTREDLAFAQRLVDWNTLDHGVQRVDAGRTRDGALLLMELEDLNPYLSLDKLGEAEREEVVAGLRRSVEACLRACRSRRKAASLARSR